MRTNKCEILQTKLNGCRSMTTSFLRRSAKASLRLKTSSFHDCHWTKLDGLLGYSRVVACLHDLPAQLCARLATHLAAPLGSFQWMRLFSGLPGWDSKAGCEAGFVALLRSELKNELENEKWIRFRKIQGVLAKLYNKLCKCPCCFP